MLRKLAILNILILLSVSSAYAQDDDESKGFVRIGVGFADFENPGSLNSTPPPGEIHYHEAALTANFVLGYGTDKLRVMALVDPATIDGVKGTSVYSMGVKGEAGLPWIKWLKLGGGIVFSENNTKKSDDIKVYETSHPDSVVSPFWSIVILPGAGNVNRFFADIRIGRSTGGDVIQPQTGKPVANSYISVSLGVHLGFRRY